MYGGFQPFPGGNLALAVPEYDVLVYRQVFSPDNKISVGEPASKYGFAGERSDMYVVAVGPGISGGARRSCSLSGNARCPSSRRCSGASE
jgi:hypothetical protein